jgi:hypothetical protein
MGAVDAIGEITRGVRYTDGPLSHKIRLSDFQQLQAMRKAPTTPGLEIEGQNGIGPRELGR